MRFSTPKKKTSGENLVPLINVVFLILIFFLAASIIRPFSDKDIVLAKTDEKTTPPNLKRLIFVGRYGPMLQQGVVASETDMTDALEAWSKDKDKPVTVVVDHRIAAIKALKVVELVRKGGFENINLLTQKARK